jgi:hypothetical protein
VSELAHGLNFISELLASGPPTALALWGAPKVAGSLGNGLSGLDARAVQGDGGASRRLISSSAWGQLEFGRNTRPIREISERVPLLLHGPLFKFQLT